MTTPPPIERQNAHRHLKTLSPEASPEKTEELYPEEFERAPRKKAKLAESARQRAFKIRQMMSKR